MMNILRYIKNIIEVGLVSGCCMVELLSGHTDIIRDFQTGKVKKLDKKLSGLALFNSTLMFISLITLVGSVGLAVQILMTIDEFDRLLEIGVPSAVFVLYCLIIYLLQLKVDKELARLHVVIVPRTSKLSETIIKKQGLEGKAKAVSMMRNLNEPILLVSVIDTSKKAKASEKEVNLKQSS
jgi:hypothetical protein